MLSGLLESRLASRLLLVMPAQEVGFPDGCSESVQLLVLTFGLQNTLGLQRKIHEGIWLPKNMLQSRLDDRPLTTSSSTIG